MNFSIAVDRSNTTPLITPDIEHNLQQLWNRKKGEKLCVVDGKLKTMNLPRRIAYACSKNYRKNVQKGVKHSIKILINNVDSVKLVENSSISKDQLITTLFFEKLAPLSTKVYGRNLKESIVNQLQLTIGTTEGIDKNASQEYVDSYNEARLWAKLGNITPLGGASGSYRITQGSVLDENGNAIQTHKHLGIFKPSDEEPLAPSNTRTCQKIKRKLLQVPILSKPFRGSMLKTVSGQAYVAEAATKIVERYMTEAAKNFLKQHSADLDTRLQGEDWLKLVNDTQIATLDIRGKGDRVGSFQLWVQEDHLEASKFFGVNELYQKSTRSAWKRVMGSFLPVLKKNQISLTTLKQKLPAELFDLLAIMDFVTGNADRHADNWFVVCKDGDATKSAEGIRLIDGGQSMAPKHPPKYAYQELHNRYLWRNLALAQETFTPMGKFIIDELCKNQSDLRQEIQALYTTHQPNENNTTLQRLACMTERLKIIKHFSHQNMTKAQLAGVRTEGHIAKIRPILQ